ncbi:MAG: sulfotransferase family protein [Bacteroidia bacterium]
MTKLGSETIVPPLASYFFSTSAFRIKPSFFIIGVQKGGTTSLSQYLEQHPAVIQPQRKDIYYFNNELKYAKGEKFYRAHFALQAYKAAYDLMHGVKSVTFDPTPNYFEAPGAAEKIHNDFKQAKLVLMLRNPIDRAFSSYQMAKRFGYESFSFEQALDAEEQRLVAEKEFYQGKPYHSYVYQRLSYKKRGAYINYIKSWKTLFGEKLLIIKSEDFFEDTPKQMKLISEFLGLKAFDGHTFEVFNKGNYADKVKPETRAALQRYYEPFNRELYAFLNRDLGWQ